jgi:oxygen-independent coproporphyrinogen-3 oxidase
MLNVRIERIGFNHLELELSHMTQLFIDEVKVLFDSDQLSSGEHDELHIRIQFQLDDGTDEGQVQVTINGCSDGSYLPSHVTHSRSLAGHSLIERNRLIKKLIVVSLNKALENATGLKQPWGILTGVRPTKLMHQLLAQHHPEQAIQKMQDEYFVTPAKATLLADIALRQRHVIPDLETIHEREVSIYIGIPFCPTKCAYCTFPAYDIRGNQGSVEQFLVGLHYEIKEIGKWLTSMGLGITTIYWGGGTPTSIEAEQMDLLFQTIHQSFPNMNRVREVTVEAGRPDTITADKLHILKKWQVDRISINPQSFTQLTLDRIGRHHTVDETVDKFHLSRSMGMNNINMDLIIGLPEEGMNELQHTLAETAKLMPESLTIHTLAFKRAAQMTKDREQYQVADRTEILAMVNEAQHWTQDHGYMPYYLYRQKNMLGNLENVGYCLEGKECLYNILMMEERQTVIGLGCGAVSKIVKSVEDDQQDRIERMPNPKDPFHYHQAYRECTEKKLKVLDAVYASKNVTNL